jgi:hypothetical protein
MALCRNVTRTADNACQAMVTAAEVDNGSFDPDGGTVMVSVSPMGPYPLGNTTVTLTVTDDEGSTATCMATVTVTNAAPVADAGADQAVSEGATVMLSGAIMDADPGQTLTFVWMQTGGPPVTLMNANTLMPTFVAPAAPAGGCVVMTFELKVTDPCGAMGMDTVTVNVGSVLCAADDSNGNKVRIVLMCPGNMAMYVWCKADGSQVSGPCTVTVTGTTISIRSKDTDPNLLEGGVDTLRKLANFRLTVPRPTRGQRSEFFTILDTNTMNSTCSCP